MFLFFFFSLILMIQATFFSLSFRGSTREYIYATIYDYGPISICSLKFACFNLNKLRCGAVLVNRIINFPMDTPLKFFKE